MIKPRYKKPKKGYNNLMLACIHMLNRKRVYYQTRSGDLLCEKCFNHYNSYGHDENGYWKIPQNEDISNLKSVCKSCVNQIIKNR